jgi:hypothetical protein
MYIYRPIHENVPQTIHYKIKFMVYIRTHVVTYIKLTRAGHISRVGISKTPKKISEGTIYGSGAVGKPQTGGIRVMTKRCQKTARGRQIKKDVHLTGKSGKEN